MCIQIVSPYWERGAASEAKYLMVPSFRVHLEIKRRNAVRSPAASGDHRNDFEIEKIASDDTLTWAGGRTLEELLVQTLW